MSDSIAPQPKEPSAPKEYAISVLKGTISAIPVIGGALNELIFEARSRLQQQRLNAFFQALATDVEALESRMLDRGFIASNEFSDLLEDICQRVARTGSEKKREHFRHVLLGALQGTHDSDFSSYFLGLVSELSDTQVTILQRFVPYLVRKQAYEAEGRRLEVEPIDYNEGRWSLAPEVAKQVVQSLIAKGLLFDDSLGRFDTPAFTIIKPTELGGRFVAWLKADSK
jgi:hypothetical protein